MNNPTIVTFLRYRYLLKNLIVRDLKVKYRRSVLGILWSLLNPIMLMLIMTAVFSTVFRGNSIEYFPCYLIVGQILFSFFNEATSTALFSVVGASALIKKVYVPKYIFPLEKVLFAFVNLMFSLAAVIVVLIIFKVPFSWTMLLFPLPLIALLMFATGVGMILATTCVFFRDMQHLYTVVTTAWMYFTPLFYPLSAIENSFIYPIVLYQPLTCYVMYFRDIVIYGNTPTPIQNILCFGYGIVFLVLGFVLFKKKQDKFILHI